MSSASGPSAASSSRTAPCGERAADRRGRAHRLEAARVLQAAGRGLNEPVPAGPNTCSTTNSVRLPSNAVGFNNPDVSWSELERTLSDNRSRHAEADPGRGRRRRQPGVVVPPAELREAGRPRAPAGIGALRRAALPLELQLPRRRLAPRGAGRGGGPARPRGAGPHRPRRLLRRGPLRRGRPGGRVCPRCSAPSCRSA